MPAITTDLSPCPTCRAVLTEDGRPCPNCQPQTVPPRAYPPPLPTPPSPPARRSIVDLLLDPRSIQWLLGSGGVLLAAGLVVWLASLGLFQNPVVVAAAMAVGTVGLLAAGWSVIRFTRHQLAGRAMTLLACLVMPLNLWFYEAHDLVTLDGHLWVAGVVCCVLYAASAWRLKDSLFVYVLSAGVAMTGLLMLADVHRFAEIAAPSTLLVVLGLIALHVERIFPPATEQGGDSPFTRQRFGRAFFWSAQALLGSGLLMLLGAQLVGWLTFPALRNAFHLVVPQIVTDPALKWWALALVAAGTYAYVYSDLVVRRVGTYLYLAAGTLVWAEVLAIDIFHLSAQPAALIVALSLTALAASALQAFLARRFLNDATRPHGSPIMIPGAHLAVLNILPVAWGVVTCFTTAPGLALGVAMLVAAACCRVGAHLARVTSPKAAVANLYASAAATLIGSSALLGAAGLATLSTQAPILMLIPMGYLVAARVQREESVGQALARVAQAAAGVIVAFTIVASTRQLLPTIFSPGSRPTSAVVHAIVLAEAAVFYALAAVFRGRTRNVYLATLAASAAVWQILGPTAATTTTYTVAFATLGLTMLATIRVALFSRDAKRSASPLITAALNSANALTSLSFVSAALLTLSHLAFKTPDVTAVLQLAALAGLSLLAALLAGQSPWRRGYVTAAIAQAALAGIALQRLMHLSTWQNVEVFAVGAGVLMLITGHLGWHREQSRNRRSDAVTTQLLLGSLFAGLPLAIAAIVARFGGDISLANEFALVTVGMILLVSGYIFQIRSTTLTGGALLVLQLAMMLVFLGVRAQLAVGVYLTLGGAAIFGTGLLLSVYRDRLATLPQRVKNREGVFEVLSWR